MTDHARYELSVRRSIAAPASKLYRAWTEAALLKRWFTPAPWSVAEAEADARPGGNIRIVMRGPEGETVDNLGVYLETVPDRRVVMTDAYSSAWVPAEKPFFTAVISFEDQADGTTLYVARALHWSEADMLAHEEMGFHEGWGRATDQLEALVQEI